jgi:uncharacterized membrane protein
MTPLYSKVKLAGHPLHTMLVAFPITFYTSAFLGYVVYAATDLMFWWRLALYANVAGVVMAVAAAVPGIVDWTRGIPPNTAAKQTGLKHMVLNVSALLLFFINLVVQKSAWPNANDVVNVAPHLTAAILLSGLGFAATLAAGWFGWTLVQTHHVGVAVDVPGAARIEGQRVEPLGGRAVTQS